MSDSTAVTSSKFKELISDAISRCGLRVHVWFLHSDGSTGSATFDTMHQLSYDWPAARNYWVDERLLILDRNGLFLSCRNRPQGHHIPNPPGIIEIRSQWALRPVPEGSYRSITATFHITPSQLERL
jgi:hypothetical protein